MDSHTPDSHTPTAAYHFVLTLQRPIGGGGADRFSGMEQHTWSSTLNTPPGGSRYQAYLDIRSWVEAQAPQWAGACVVHWSLELDTLPHPAEPVLPAGPPPAPGTLPGQRRGE